MPNNIELDELKRMVEEKKEELKAKEKVFKYLLEKLDDLKEE